MLDGKRIAILVEDGFEDSELIEPLRSMKNAGARTVIIGNGNQNTYRGKRGYTTVRADAKADGVKAGDLDAIIVPGGEAPEKMSRHQAIVDLVKKADEDGKLVAAICRGPLLLIAAGIVNGRRVTSCSSIVGELRNAGAEWVDQPVVRDGNIITSRRPSDLPRFNKIVIEALREQLKTEL